MTTDKDTADKPVTPKADTKAAPKTTAKPSAKTTTAKPKTVTAAKPAAKSTKSAPAKPTQPKKPTAKADQPSGTNRLPVVLALLVALIALGGVIYLWWLQTQTQQVQTSATTQQFATQTEQLNTLRSSLAALQAQVSAASSSANDANLKIATQQGETSSALSQLRNGLNDQAARTAEVSETVAAQLRSMRHKLDGSARQVWIEGEVEYLLRFANQRLALNRDRHTALVALEAADARLADLKDLRFIDTRAALRTEIAALKNFAAPDLTGAALSISAYLAQIPQLPLRISAPTSFTPNAKTAAAEDAYTTLDEPEWQQNARQALRDFWQELKTLVVIRRDQAAYEMLLAPEHEFLIYQNLQLQLAAIRIALLRGDQALFSHSVNAARDWLNAWFMNDSSKVNVLDSELEKLAKLELQPSLPDITQSLSLFRDTIAKLNAAEDAKP